MNYMSAWLDQKQIIGLLCNITKTKQKKVQMISIRIFVTASS